MAAVLSWKRHALYYTCLVVDKFFWGFGIVLLASAAVLIGMCVWVYYWWLLPLLFPQLSVGLAVNFLVSVWLLTNLVFNYTTAVTTSAGEPPKADPQKPPAAGVKVCRKCSSLKPPRTHHCSICNKCYYMFDHHCPWMHNCIGHNNRRYFVMTLVYLWIGCIYYSSVAFIPFYRLHHGLGVQFGGVPMMPGMITFSFILAVAMVLSVGALMFWHLYLVMTAQTSLEFYINRYEAQDMRLEGQVFVNEYDLGVRWNLIYFFNICERYPWWMALIPVRVPPVGDGSFFITVRYHLDYMKSMQELASVNVAKLV